MAFCTHFMEGACVCSLQKKKKVSNCIFKCCLLKTVNLLKSALQTNEASCASTSYLQAPLNIQGAVIATILFHHKKKESPQNNYPPDLNEKKFIYEIIHLCSM